MNHLFKMISVVLLLILFALIVLYIATGAYHPISVIAVILFVVAAAATSTEQ